MKSAALLILVLAVCIPSEGFSQTVTRAPAGARTLAQGWDWAMTQPSPGSSGVSAVVWTIDSDGSNWRWDNQGAPLSELLGVPTAAGIGVAIVVVLQRGEVDLLHTQDVDWPLRRDVSRVMYLGGSSQEESFNLVSTLKLPSSDLQRARLHVAAIHRDVPDAGSLIVEALASSSRDMRKAAAHAWAQFGGEDALPRLTALAVDDSDVEVAKAATYAIGSIDASASVDALVDVLDDSTRREVRKAAAYALGNLGTPEAKAVLIRLIRTEQ